MDSTALGYKPVTTSGSLKGRELLETVVTLSVFNYIGCITSSGKAFL